MKWLWFYIVCWKHRSDTHEQLFEQYTLVLKAARRCAYDMDHAATTIWRLGRDKGDTRGDCEFYSERSREWLKIFSPTGGKDYRHRLHDDIRHLEYEIERLKKVCEENGVDHVDPDAIPF